MTRRARVPAILASCLWATACVNAGVARQSLAAAPATVVTPARCLATTASGGEAGEHLLALPPASMAGAHTAVRWASHITRPLRIWIEDASNSPGWDAGDVERVKTAFEAWEGTGLPLRFVYVQTRDEADVTVHWTDHFTGHYDGWTTVRWDHDGWITGGDVRLALHKPNGDPLSAAARQAIATHEIGHVLGLAHSVDPGAVMAATVNVTSVTPVDVTAIGQLYAVAPTETASVPTTVVRTASATGGHTVPCEPVRVE